jgi:hypothetical protein
MKTSKIIFISLLGTVALLIMATTIDIKLNGHKANTYPSDIFKAEKTGVADYKVLSLNNCNNIELTRKDSSSVAIIYLKDSLLPHLNYISSGDTLFITDARPKNHSAVSYKIQATGSLSQIVMKNSVITMKIPGSGSLVFDLNGSTININNDGVATPKMSSLIVSAVNHSSFSTGEFRVDSMDLTLQKSEAYLEVIAKKIHGTLQDSSKMYARQPDEVYLKKDSTSTMSLNEN